jgi:lipopolysaccharide export system permease protein
MKTLDRYIAISFLKHFGLALLGLTVLYLTQALLGELLDHEFSTTQILAHNFMGVPQIMVQMTPPAVLVATALSLSGLNRSNELVACFSLGVGIWRIMSTVISLVIIVCCLTLVLQDRILPPLFKKRTNYYWRDMKKRTDFHLDVKQNKIWYRSKNLIYNLRTFDTKSRTIYGMSVYTFDGEFNLLQVIDAERATYLPGGWQLMKGTVTVFTKEDPFPITQKFEKKELQITETPKDFQEIEKEVDGLRLKELYRYIDRVKQAGTDTKSYEVKFHSRISLSFIPIVMCFLAVPFSIRHRRDGGVAKDLGICLGFTFFYWLFYSVGLSLGTNGTLPPWLAAWLPSVIFAAVAVTFIARRQTAS